MKYVGVPVPVCDAVAKVTGEAAYTDDLVFPNLLWGMILGSPYAHARIVSIDTSQAEALPGVHAVVTYRDAPPTVYCRNMRRIHDDGPATERVFNQTVRYVGDKVAAVAAESEEIARKALRLIQVEYEPLPAVFDAEEALSEDAPKLYPEGNLVRRMEKSCGDVEEALRQSDHVIDSDTQTAMIHHAAIEPHVCVAYWSRENELSVWEPQRAPFRMQIMLGKIFQIPYSKIHVHGQIIGGTFGSKEGVMLEPVALMLSRKSGRYVKIRYSRKECITSTFTRHAMKMHTRIGVNKDGTITAIDVKAYMQVGPYCGDSLTVLIGMQGKFFKLYGVPNMRFVGLPAYTNTPLGGAMRGYGSPNIFLAIETAIDEAARRLKLDPVEFRMKNLMHPYDVDPTNGQTLGNGRVLDCLERGVKLFDYYARRARCAEMEDERYLYGCGFATTLHGNGVSPGATDITVVSIELHEDGTVLLRTGVTDHGAGTYTLYHQLVAEVLDMPMDHVELVWSDTHQGHYDKGAGSSRNTWVGGKAVVLVAEELRREMVEVAALMLETDRTCVTLEDGRFCGPSGRSVSKIDVAEYACEKQRRKLIKVLSYHSPRNAGSYGAHFAQVRVDKHTGEVRVTDYLAVCDVGHALNPMLLEGQVEGAIMMGIGAALYEEIKLDEKGAVVNGSFKKYRIAKLSDLPNIQVEFVEKGEPGGPFGAKSIGEASLVPVAPAVINALSDALGAKVTNMPATPEKVKALLDTRAKDV